ncbi:MAG: hypothetical protein QXR89_07105 [Candidatus Bathyarchaeia archaeon]
MGLESTRQELNAIKETIEKLSNPQAAESGTILKQQEVEQKPAESSEKSSLEVAVVELTPKVEAESIGENLQETQQVEQIEQKNEE